MRQSRLSWSKQLCLIEHFVSCSMVRCTSRLIGVNKSTGAYYFHRLREIIALELEARRLMYLAARSKLTRVTLVDVSIRR